MDTITPPPLPTSRPNRRRTFGIFLAISGAAVALCVLTPVVLRDLGLIQPFVIPYTSMAPTIDRGDHIYTERLSYLMIKPRHGDVVVFRADGIRGLPPHTFYVKRLVGVPGDELSVSHGLLCVNGQPFLIRQQTVDMAHFARLSTRYLGHEGDTMKVPEQQCFVLSDNLAGGVDSRYWGCLPLQAIQSRALLCYWPVRRWGFIH